MTIQEVLSSNDSKILKANIKILAKDYKEKLKGTVCLNCPSDIQFMINRLKKKYKMTNFQLRKPHVIYKLEKGGSETISNDKMTDELALRFLKIKNERIDLFSKYPENWIELLGEDNNEDNVDEKVNEVVKETSKKPCATCKDKKISEAKNATPKRTYKKRGSTKK
ncbi:hypothetical protein ACFSKN_04710 [Mariniflexile gromovii]|uniref:Uncharacterized protein n=1 Tax=Mariniflexile gromovii TaxID=362523 RepID=A0ABS4BW81_9FLAO|nr:hypothetical protein [Mariniflexile gromovii]MBP0904851.1 hypothetical protein [Mariniflexile gromovii]